MKSGAGFRLIAVLLAIVFVGEFFWFDRFGSRRVTSIYPRWNDQIQYLTEAYSGYEFARQHGWGAGLWHSLTNPSAQGTLHDLGAVLAFSVAGPSRSAALALNMLALIAWQAALFFSVARCTRNKTVATLAALLPLALAGPWENVPGSAYDFRLDHLALCALGISSAVAVLTDGFRHRFWTLAFGLCVGFTLLTRFITGTYFAVLLAIYLVSVAVGGGRRQRALNLLGATLLAAAVAGPILWLNRESVWNYYYIGHYIGPESAIRNQNFGVLRSLGFVFRWLGERHLGPFFGLLCAGLGATLAAMRSITKSAPGGPDDSGSVSIGTKPLLTSGLAFLFAPALVLTLHPQKSEVVLSALVPGVVLIATAMLNALYPQLGRRDGRRVTPGSVIGILGCASALAFFTQRQVRAIEHPWTLASAREVNLTADHIFRTSEASGLNRPRVAVDNITDAFDARVLRVVCYERHHVERDFEMKLPNGIGEPKAEDVRQAVAESDFVFLTGNDIAPGSYPYDRKLAEMRPELRMWCEAHMRFVRTFQFGGVPITLYQRRELVSPPGTSLQ